MNVRIERKYYSRDFKLEAVKLFESSIKPKSHIANDLGICESLLYSWAKQFKAKGDHAFKNMSQLTEEQVEIKRLRIENRRLREERDILKKATAFFARESK